MAKKRVVRFRFYIIVAVAVLLVAGGIWYFLVPPGDAAAQQGTMAFEKQVKTVIVRDEKTVTQENYGKISFIAAEGQKVAANTKVAQVYAWGYSDKVLQDLIKVQTDIKAYQENNILKQVFEKDLQTVNEKIDAQVTKLSSGANGLNDLDLIKIESDLKTLMQQQKDLLKRACTPDETLQKLYDRETELQKRLNAWISDVKTKEAGTISFYFDGFEQIMTPDQIDKLKRSDIDNIINNAAIQKIDVSEGSKPLYRLVNSNKWYCLIATEKDDKLQTDMVYDIAFEGFFNQPYTGRLLSQREMDDGVLYVLEINDDIGPLLSVRKANATLKKTYTGLKVPINALTTQGDTQGITAVENGNDVFKPVKVVYKDNEFAIIEAADANQPVEPNTKIRLHR
ncbi:MAG: HlyD family efflux transporter periplasmic adaptor subunit [Bacillota bacterium]